MKIRYKILLCITIILLGWYVYDIYVCEALIRDARRTPAHILYRGKTPDGQNVGMLYSPHDHSHVASFAGYGYSILPYRIATKNVFFIAFPDKKIERTKIVWFDMDDCLGWMGLRWIESVAIAFAIYADGGSTVYCNNRLAGKYLRRHLGYILAKKSWK